MLNLKPFPFQLKRFKNGKLKIPGKTKYKWFTSPHRVVERYTEGAYQPVKLKKFEPGSRDKIKLWLKHDLDFEFSTFTEKGSAKVDADELESIGEQGANLVKYLKLTKDYSQLGGTDNSLIAKFNPNTHCIHGKVDTVGATTHRATHSSPNLAQIPSDGAFRKLFTVPDGWDFVGADLANIEIRVLAHYLAEHGNPRYAEAVLSKDMHWFHAKLAGFWTKDDRDWDESTATPEMVKARKASKAFFFGYLYGQGSSIRGNTLSSGQAIEWYNTTTNERGVCP